MQPASSPNVMNLIQSHRELVVALLILAAATVSSPAAQHRATRLGDPAHRFAPPLTKPEDLRTLLLNDQLKDDIASILDQAGWKGNLEDLRNAAAVADIVERKLPKGTLMPFMSSRNNGLPIALMEVEWIGREPIEAYAFEFKSNHRLYRLVTPKPCSNFFVEDLGPEPPPPPVPAVKAILELPASGGLCDSIPTRLTVRNTGTMTLTHVEVHDVLGPGLATVAGQSRVVLDGGELVPGMAKVWTLNCKALQAGAITNVMRVTCAEKAADSTMASMVIHAPQLVATCTPPPEAYLGRPVKVCLGVANTGDAAEPAVNSELSVPPGATFLGATEGGALTGDRVVARPPAGGRQHPGVVRDILLPLRRTMVLPRRIPGILRAGVDLRLQGGSDRHRRAAPRSPRHRGSP
jgi:hypothetical protein